jgi:hypothetical protein
LELNIILGVLVALIALIGVLISLVVKKKGETSITLQCASHELFMHEAQNRETRISLMESKITGLSTHITSIEGKLDILLADRADNFRHSRESEARG